MRRRLGCAVRPGRHTLSGPDNRLPSLCVGHFQYEGTVNQVMGDGTMALFERFGLNNIVAATSRAWLSYCHAELGTFAEGLALAEEGLWITETVNSPFT